MKRKARLRSKKQMRKGYRLAFKSGEPGSVAKLRGWEYSGHYVYRNSSRGAVQFD